MDNEQQVRNLINVALEKYASGNRGAPFEQPVLQALLTAKQQNLAEFQRLKGALAEKGVPMRDLSEALKVEAEKARQNASSRSGEAVLSLERIEELERKGFICDPVKGIVDINPNLFAKYVLRTFELRFTKGERFFLFERSVWRHLAEKELQRRLARLIEAAQADVWRPAWESAYMTTLARLAKSVKEFDTFRSHLNLANGMFNTDTLELEEHHPDFHSSIQNPLVYDETAECPRFLRFLDEVFQGDKQTIGVVQEMMGYCCTAETRAHKMFILEGVGSNGKSVLIEIIEHLCGKQNVSHVAMNELSQPFARAELVGKLLNVSSENEFSEKGLNTQYVKSIAAGDMIRVENKHEKGFNYRPVCKLLFGMNALPATMDKSHGFFRRLVIIPFRRVFKGAEADKMLLEKLLEELPGIFNFAMDGLRRLQERDFVFSESEAIEQAVNSYKAEQNPVIPFVSDFVDQGSDDDRVSKNELFDRFQVWCRQQGETDIASRSSRDRRVFWTAFRNALLEAGIPMPEERQSNGFRFLHGLKMLKEAKPSMADIFDDGDEQVATEAAPGQQKGRGLSGQKVTARVSVGGKFGELLGDDSNEWLSADEVDDDYEEFESEEELNHESIQFDLNYLPAQISHGLQVREWLDGKPEHFDFDNYPFHLSSWGEQQFVSLRC